MSILHITGDNKPRQNTPRGRINHKDHQAKLYTLLSSHSDSSSIQTILSVPELNRFSLAVSLTVRVADYTAGREFRPALKNNYSAKLLII